MDLPKNLAAALAAADEGYLTGLCNKGTVNRAKKDLAALSPPEVRPEGDGVEVRMGDTVCLIRAPLGESRCSCPSGGICRHRITAILWLKEQAGGPPEPEEKGPDFGALRAYPTEKLVKQLGAKRLSAVLFRHRSGTGPKMTERSVVTVELPWLPATVRLLEPLAHSTCTCHSRQFCVHKAEALLFWQLKEGVARPEALEEEETFGEGWDAAQVRGIAQSVEQTLAAQLATGLSRLSPGVCETVERMASLCHTARLPNLERALRSLHGEYAAYFARSATYRDTALLARLARAFRLARGLEGAGEEEIRKLAGVFREEYEPVGHLRLYLLGLRELSVRGGYRGTVYYFWEREERTFYTFSDLRPTFYQNGEGSARRPEAAAPWGLPCTLRQAWNCALDLTGAKATRGGNLSSTGTCAAVLSGRLPPGKVFPPEEIDTDFSALLEKKSAPHSPERDRLAVIRPAACEPQAYDRVRQVFSLRLLDGAGRDLWVEVGYKKTEAGVVEQLEGLARQLEEGTVRRPVFFGVLYREAGRLKLYPIEYFTRWQEAL